MIRNFIVLGASAGGVLALQKLAAALPANLDAALFVVIHVTSDGPALMADILNAAGPLKALYARDDEPFENGHIYLPPPDHHLLLEADRMRVVRGPKENWHRPAIDPLFRSAAVQHGARVIGVVLTGYRTDGTSGLLAVKDHGGTAVVQDPEDAAVAGMPASALRRVPGAHCLPLSGIAPLLVRLVSSPVSATPPMPMAEQEASKVESRIPLGEFSPEIADQLGTRSIFSCPECNGGLWEIRDRRLLRYRCHVGHAFDAEVLSGGQEQAVENALWIAMRTLEEHRHLNMQMAERAADADDQAAREVFARRAEQASEKMGKLRARSSPTSKGKSGIHRSAATPCSTERRNKESSFSSKPATLNGLGM